jgi:hypothetical protein
MLASNYGWAKDDILENVYLDEVLYLRKLIHERKVDDIKLQLNIVQNPHTKNPRELYDKISSFDRRPIAKPKFDKVGFQNLKAALDKSPRFIVK